MSSYRLVYRCPNCGKIYRWRRSMGHLAAPCKRCGCRDNFDIISAKPKLLGLRGWALSSCEEKLKRNYCVYFTTPTGGGTYETPARNEEEAAAKFLGVYPMAEKSMIKRVIRGWPTEKEK